MHLRAAAARQAIADNANVCKQLHMPAQSGSTAVLARMRRGYTRAAYDALLRRVREHIPQVRCPLSTPLSTVHCPLSIICVHLQGAAPSVLWARWSSICPVTLWEEERLC